MSQELSTTMSNKTMSSLEIAELTGKNHADVLRDIRNILEQAGIGESKFACTYLSNQNKELVCYSLPRMECDLVISGYSVQYRMAIIKRWHDLEGKPKTIIDYARELIASHEQVEKLEQQLQITGEVLSEKRKDVTWLEDRLEKEIETKKLYGVWGSKCHKN